MPVFPSAEWFDAVRQAFNADDANRTAGGGTCDASVGVKVGDQSYLLVFEGFECTEARAVDDAGLQESDFVLGMASEEWREMVSNIRESGGADLDHTLNTLDLTREEGLARSMADDQYRQDLFFRYNQTFQYFFDASAKVDTVFEPSTEASSRPSS